MTCLTWTIDWENNRFSKVVRHFLSNQVSCIVDFFDSAIPIMNFVSIFISVLMRVIKKIFTVVCLMKKSVGS